MYGIFSYPNQPVRAGYKVGERILDLAATQDTGHFQAINLPTNVFTQPALNDFIALGKPVWLAVEQRINELIREDSNRQNTNKALFIGSDAAVQMHLPVRVGDYTDFYAGIYHAENVGRLFRPAGEPLLPNYRQMPVAYHGRASSIVVSGSLSNGPTASF